MSNPIVEFGPMNALGVNRDGELTIRRGRIWGSDGAPVEFPDGIASSGGDTFSVRAFGAKGDGVTDDTAAILLAIVAAAAVGGVVSFPAGTFVCRPIFITIQNVRWSGVFGKTTILRKPGQASAQLLNIQANGFEAAGIIFDGNGPNVTGDTYLVIATSAVSSCRFERCRFTRNIGSTVGMGLSFAGLDAEATISRFEVIGCEFDNNQVDGFWSQSADNLTIRNCFAHDNGRHGINVDISSVSHTKVVQRAFVVENRSWSNGFHGIVIGNFNASDTVPIVWSSANPDAVDVIASRNTCFDNGVYEMYVSGDRIGIFDNILRTVNAATFSANSALLCLNSRATIVRGNLFSSIGYATGKHWGIDAGGSTYCSITGNHFYGVYIGVNAQNVGNRVSQNQIMDCFHGVTVQITEGSGGFGGFDGTTNMLDVSDNFIRIPDNTGWGVRVLDAAQGVRILNNRFEGLAGASVVAGRCIEYRTDSLEIRGNSFNGATAGQTIDYAANHIEFADVFDTIFYGGAFTVTGLVSYLQWLYQGTVMYAKVTNGGSGWGQTGTTLTFSGGGGTGAAGTPIVDSTGKLIGVQMTNIGSGYTSAPTITVNGTGTGAVVAAQVNLRQPQHRRLSLYVSAAGGGTFGNYGSSYQTGFSHVAGMSNHFPQLRPIELMVLSNVFTVLNNPTDTYGVPDSSGNITLKSNGGKVLIQNLPTAATGLPSGTLWNNAGTLAIAP